MVITNTKNSFEDLQCIWMTSNVVEYKLCDRDFDCENCPFDRVIRNISEEHGHSSRKFGNQPGDIIDALLQKQNELTYENNIIYLKEKLILKHQFANIYYLGISPILLNAMDDISGINISDSYSYIIKDEKIIELAGVWGALTINSPMNFLLLDRMNCSPAELLQNRWIAIIAVNKHEIYGAKITEDQWQFEKDWSIKLISSYKYSPPLVGATMRDGGTKLKYIHQLIGNVNYLSFLNQLFKNKPGE